MIQSVIMTWLIADGGNCGADQPGRPVCADICSSFYLLQQIRKQGLTDDCLQVIFNSIIYNRILFVRLPGAAT